MIDINALPEYDRVLEQARRNTIAAFDTPQRPLADADWQRLIKAAEDILKIAGAK